MALTIVENASNWGRPHWEESQAMTTGGAGTQTHSPPDPDRQGDPHTEVGSPPQPAGPKGLMDSTPSGRPDTAPSVEDPPEETLELNN